MGLYSYSSWCEPPVEARKRTRSEGAATRHCFILDRFGLENGQYPGEATRQDFFWTGRTPQIQGDYT